MSPSVIGGEFITGSRAETAGANSIATTRKRDTHIRSSGSLTRDVETTDSSGTEARTRDLESRDGGGSRTSNRSSGEVQVASCISLNPLGYPHSISEDGGGSNGEAI